MPDEKKETLGKEAIRIADEIFFILETIKAKFHVGGECRICLVPSQNGTLMKVAIENSSAISSTLPPEVTGSPQYIRKVVLNTLRSVLA